MINRLRAAKKAKQEADQRARINLFGTSVLMNNFPTFNCQHSLVVAPKADQWMSEVLVRGDRKQITYVCERCHSHVTLPVEE